MKTSDIEEFKAIGFMAVGVMAYGAGLEVVAIIMWALAAISFVGALIIAYYERAIKKQKQKLGLHE